MEKKLNHYLTATIALAKVAGAKILEVYHSGDFAIETKLDTTPVTRADFLAHQIIVDGLKQLTPSLPVLSEEAADIPFAERQQWQQYWLVDPLDGTRAFIKKSGEFTVNIALICNHQPILGVVYVPIKDICYFAAEHSGAYMQQDSQAKIALQARSWNKGLLRILLSRYSDEKRFKVILEQFEECEMDRVSSAWKFGLMAAGEADIYPRFGPTSEWDTAAGQCVLEQAGGKVLDFMGKPLRYNTKESLENPQFLALGNSELLLNTVLNIIKKGEL
jgi:3'(2'), 5'-bisphosphate nucleotidase